MKLTPAQLSEYRSLRRWGWSASLALSTARNGLPF